MLIYVYWANLTAGNNRILIIEKFKWGVWNLLRALRRGILTEFIIFCERAPLSKLQPIVTIGLLNLFTILIDLKPLKIDLNEGELHLKKRSFDIKTSIRAKCFPIKSIDFVNKELFIGFWAFCKIVCKLKELHLKKYKL